MGISYTTSTSSVARDQTPQNQRGGSARDNRRGRGDRRTEFSEVLLNGVRVQVRHQTFLRGRKPRLAVPLRVIACSRLDGPVKRDHPVVDQVFAQYQWFDGLVESLPAFLDELEGSPVQMWLEQDGLYRARRSVGRCLEPRGDSTDRPRDRHGRAGYRRGMRCSFFNGIPSPNRRLLAIQSSSAPLRSTSCSPICLTILES